MLTATQRLVAVGVILCLLLGLLVRSRMQSQVPTTQITVDLAHPRVTSSLAVGATHLLTGVGSVNADLIAQARAENLLRAGVTYNNRAIYGWGLPDPMPAAGDYNWAPLDNAVTQLEKAGGIPVLTLCCAPGWMTALGHMTGGEPDYSAAPLPQHYEDFANLAATIAHRYPGVTHFQVWNELKGFNWNMSPITGYTALYNDVYDALKAVNPQIQVGGPYLPIIGGELPGLSGPDVAPIPIWQMNDLDTWLTYKHGADFLAIDYSVLDNNATVPSPPAPQSFLDLVIGGTARFAAIVEQIRADPHYKGLPIWFSEDYCDTNLARIGYMSDAYQGACLASILYHELVSGAAVSLRWSAEGNILYQSGGNADQESLYTDTTVQSGGQPYPAYWVYKAVHDYFGPGTQLYATISTSPTILALASASTVLLINQTNEQRNVVVNGVRVVLAPYEVTTIATPTTPIPPATTVTP